MLDEFGDGWCQCGRWPLQGGGPVEVKADEEGDRLKTDVEIGEAYAAWITDEVLGDDRAILVDAREVEA
jgi:hypothetical protein